MFKSDYIQALNDYKRVRRKEAIRALISKISGSPADMDLLSYEKVRKQLQAIEKNTPRLKDIPLDAILGSVGRYQDFTRKYLPKSSIDEQRWARVKASTMGLTGLPPIEVYQIGEVYFVKDGNHRVSVARQMENPAIQAYVTEVKSKVDLTTDVTPDEIIIKAEQVKFLEITKLDELRPGGDLSATKAGAYPALLEHIEVHRYYMGLEGDREIPYRESAAHWYDEVFLPIANIIRNRNLLRDFPDRTVADLYLWTAEHRAELESGLGWDIGPEAALNDLAIEHDKKLYPTLLIKWTRRISNLLPRKLEGGPPPGTWRERLEKKTVLEHIFNNIIVALDDSPNAWYALDMATELGKNENSRIHGIHVHPPGSKEHDHIPTEERFNKHCQNARIREFNYQFLTGEIGSLLCESARYSDLIVLPLNHPPRPKPN